MKFDVELNYQDLQQLSSADNLSAFFTRLGYNTNIRTVQTLENLDLTADAVARPITHIELLAEQQGLFQVYLFEVKSVTVSHTKALVRKFRNKAGNFMLVLTSDYERLDFVLVERVAAISKVDATGTTHMGTRARVLTVSRRDPGNVALRVLKRFTYTESDPYYQFDKLLAAYAIAEWSEDYFNNRALFSDYYLVNRLPGMDEWKVDPKPAYQILRDIYKDSISSYRPENEEHLREQLFIPTFKALGFIPFEGKAADDASHSKADYTLFEPGKKSAGERPLALALVYPWGRFLDGKDDQRDHETSEENPGAAVVSLLERDDAPDWAIVSNGQTWRLYSKKTHSRATNYYEIDLVEALSLGSPNKLDPAAAFRYFWLFFRREAFETKQSVEESAGQSACFLDELLEGSAAYSKQLGERLKERVFEDIFPYLAEGFISGIRRAEGKSTEIAQERLDAVYHGTLTLLYRLLFLLYAESRDLLPARERGGYFESSLKRLKEEIAEKAGNIQDEAPEKIERAYRNDSSQLYERLNALFRIVDKGDEKHNVPIYNGGLFITDPGDVDDAEAVEAVRFLAGNAVPDNYLAPALDKLARDIDDKRHDLVFIDYKSLGVRQLGSIYEGLLEFRLRVAAEKMAIVKGKKAEEVIPYRELAKSGLKIATVGRGKNAVEKTLPEGAVYLENDKRERKATGSYYTPDHIVKYIVENAVGPVLNEKLEALRTGLRGVQRQQRAWRDKQAALKKQGLSAEPEEKLALIGREIVDELFKLRVLDPAMGSGHFLVEAVDFISNKLIAFLNGFPGNPVLSFLDETRRTIINELEEQKVSVDIARLTDVNLLKRHVLKRCVYGVDLNPMAVELARVSLWLDCFTLGAPLSFLDHHLRCGNSLIGVTVEETREAVEKGQLALFGSQFTGLMLATDLMRQVGEVPDVTSRDVKQSRRQYAQALTHLQPFKRILDVYTSQWFGNEAQHVGRGKDKKTHEPVKIFMQSPEFRSWLNNPQGAKLSELGRSVADSAVRAAREKRFFHWELEFPEVFYGPVDGNRQKIERIPGAGFDAVVGNPPYIPTEGMDEHFKSFVKSHHSQLERKYDSSALFILSGLQKLKINSYLGYITSVTWQTGENYCLLRQHILSEYGIRYIINLPFDVFPDAYVDSGIFIFSSIKNDILRILPIPKNAKTYSLDKVRYQDLKIEEIKPPEYKIFQRKAILSISTKLLGANFSRLGELSISTQGLASNCFETHSIVNDTYQFPFFEKGQIYRYKFVLESVSFTDMQEHSNLTPYYIDTPKILIRRVINREDRLMATYYADKMIFKKDINPFIIDTAKANPLYLLGIINSKFISFYYVNLSSIATKDDFRQTTLAELRRIPIRPIDFDNPADCARHERMVTLVETMLELNKHLQAARNSAEKSELQTRIDAADREIDALVYELYDLTDEEIAIVEGTRSE